jgi:hypothetical protein
MARSRAKKARASSIVMASTSATERSRSFTPSTASWKRRPPHDAHTSDTSARNCISIVSKPSPAQASQRPPATLNEKAPGPSSRASASGVFANAARTWLHAPE